MKTLAGVSATIVESAGVGTAALTDPRFWGVLWAVILALGLAGGGYRLAEVGAKLLVSIVVVAFVASAFVVPIDPVAAANGLKPAIPAGVDGALVAAGILGGAVHITLLTMQSYTMRARGWTARDADIATFDVVSSMLVAFGIFSLGVFLVAASVLPSAGVDPATIDGVGAAQTLGPIAGEYATWLFLAGLLGAAVSTLGGNTIVPPYLLADKLGWEQSVTDGRYRAAIVAVALASAVGAFPRGSVLPVARPHAGVRTRRHALRHRGDPLLAERSRGRPRNELAAGEPRRPRAVRRRDRPRRRVCPRGTRDGH